MQHTLSFIRQILSPYYPDSEITGFIRHIFKKTCNYSTADLIIRKNNTLSESVRNEIDKIVMRLTQYEPIQYILGECEFMGFSFQVAPGVLIPRPETEELVDRIVRETTFQPTNILDIGTGSGCIAISLSLLLPQTTVFAWDISTDALAIAQENNRRLNGGVTFCETDILNFNPHRYDGPNFQILVSNPPYICQEEQKTMERNVLDYEPHNALFVPDDDPLLFYRAIAQIGQTLIAPKGKIYFEINSRFGTEIVQLLQQTGYEEINVFPDIFGHDRIVSASKI